MEYLDMTRFFTSRTFKRWPLWGAALVALAAETAGAAEPTIHLFPGGATELALPHDATLNVSRRGVVDLHLLGDDRWRVTALHSGVVLIEARAPDAEPHEAVRYLIDVAPAAEERKRERGRNVALPEWLCAPDLIRCDSATGIVSGTAPSWGWLVQAADACQPAHGCLLQAGLDEAARASWKAALAAFAAPEKISVSAEGFVQFGRPCAEGDGPAPERAPFPEGLVPKSRLAERCLPAFADPGYELSARIFLVDEADARNLGFDSNVDATLAAGLHVAPTATAAALSRLEALASQHRATVVGEPRLRLLPGRDVTLRAGGEFQVAEFRDEHRGAATNDTHERVPAAASWKQTGLEMTVRAGVLQGEAAHLDFDAALRLRARTAGDPMLTVGSVHSSFDLPLGVPQLAATLDLATDADGGTETPIFARMPLIGPLFQTSAREHARHRLVVWLTLARAPLPTTDAQRSKLR